MSYLTFTNIKKVYNKKVEAVKDFNLEIEQGEFIVFLGPSGCGKTTTLRMIAGLESVTEGDIKLEGQSIINLEPKDRGISMIFQSYAIWPHMSVFDNVAYALKLKKMSKEDIKERVNQVAEISDIKPYLDRYPSQLSGGQRQRVAVARAIAIEPKLFLMDEPLSNLDAKLRVSVRTDLKRIHQELGTTSIFVTHDQSEALSLADRIVVINNGQIEQVGTPDEIYHESATMFIAKFIGSPPANFFNVKVTKEKDDIILVNKEFSYKPDESMSNSLSKYLNENIILSVRPEKMSLNEKNFLFKSKVTVIEPQGSHVIVNFDVDSENVKVQKDSIDFKLGDEVKIGFKTEPHYFDPKTEKRIV